MVRLNFSVTPRRFIYGMCKYKINVENKNEKNPWIVFRSLWRVIQLQHADSYLREIAVFFFFLNISSQITRASCTAGNIASISKEFWTTWTRPFHWKGLWLGTLLFCNTQPKHVKFSVYWYPRLTHKQTEVCHRICLQIPVYWLRGPGAQRDWPPSAVPRVPAPGHPEIIGSNSPQARMQIKRKIHKIRSRKYKKKQLWCLRTWQT